jgi:hypothetical protein
LSENLPDLRLTDLVIAEVIEVDLVDGSTGRNDKQFIHCSDPPKREKASRRFHCRFGSDTDFVWLRVI